MKGPKPSHVRRTVVLAGAQIGAQKYKSVPPVHKNNCSIRLSNIKYLQQPTIRRLQKGYGKIQ